MKQGLEGQTKAQRQGDFAETLNKLQWQVYLQLAAN
jgi:hypothetical protein